MQQTVTYEALRRAAARIGTVAGGTPAGHYLDRLLDEVEAEADARRREVEAEVRRRWEECSGEIEAEVSEYAANSYLYWIEDADRDYDDEDQTPERRRVRFATLGEWADAERTDIDEGTGFYPTYFQDIGEHAREFAEGRLIRESDPDDLREALERSISARKWHWPGIEADAIVAA